MYRHVYVCVYVFVYVFVYICVCVCVCVSSPAFMSHTLFNVWNLRECGESPLASFCIWV
jgi:hypothetical protein